MSSLASAHQGVLRERWIVAGWLLGVGILAVLLCLPFLRLVLFEEEGTWLNAAARLRHGQTIYRDFFQFHAPLSFIMTASWLDVAGPTLAGAHMLAMLVTAGSACFIYLACRQATGSSAAGAFCAVAWLVVSQGFWTQINHHWFASFFSLVVAWAALPSTVAGRTAWWRPLVAGMAGGAAAMVSQSRGTLIVLASAAVFLHPRRSRRDMLTFVAGVASVPFAMLAYVAGHNALADAYSDVILFTLQNYSQIQPVPYGHATTLQTFPAALIYPGCAVALLAVVIRNRRALLHDQFLPAAAGFAIAGFIGSFPRPDGTHLCFTMPLALPLAARCAVLLGQGWPGAVRRFALAAAVCLMLPAAAFLLLIGLGTSRIPMTQTAAGAVQFADQGGKAGAIMRLDSLPPGDAVFFYPYNPLLAALSGRGQVSRYDLFVPGYTTTAQYQEACTAVMRDADWLLLDRGSMSNERLQQIYPAMTNPSPPERIRFERALETWFEQAAQDGNYELRHRTSGTRATLCESGWD